MSGQTESAAASAILLTWSLAGDGPMQRHITSLAAGLSRRGTDVTLLVASFTGLPAEVESSLAEAGVRIESATPLDQVRAASHMVRGRLGTALQRAVGRPAPRAFHAANDIARMLTRRIARGPADVIHLHSWRLGLAAIAGYPSTGIPVVITEHAPPGEWAEPPSSADQSAAKGAAAVIATAEGTDALLQQHLDRDIRTLPRPGRAGIVAARAVPRRVGHHTPLRLVAPAGDDRDKAWIAEAVALARATHDIDLTIIDPAAPSSTPVPDTDLVCLTPGCQGAFRMAVDAAALGVPLVIGGTIPGLGLVHRADALIVEPGNPDALAGALREMAADPVLAEALAVAACRRAARWPDDAVAAETTTLYVEAGAARP